MNGICTLKTLLIAFFVLFFTGFSPWALYQDFDTDDTSTDADEKEMIFDEDIIPDETQRDQESVYHSIFSKVKLSLQHKVAMAIIDEVEWVTHASQLKSEVEHLFFNRLFIRFDGHTGVYHAQDHRSIAEGKNSLYHGDIDELYAQVSGDHFTAALGKRIIVWGEADTGAITDIFSPRDVSDFLFTDLENSRMGVIMASLSGYSSLGSMELIVSPLVRGDRNPSAHSRYDLTDGSGKEKDPDPFKTEVGLRWKQAAGAMDISLMAGSFFNNAAVYESHIPDGEDRIRLTERYKRFEMAGGALVYTLNRFLLKMEGAYKKKIPLQAFDAHKGFFPATCDLLDAAAGIEYDANARYRISVEASHRYIIDSDRALYLGKKHHTLFYASFSKDFFNESLKTQLIVYYDPEYEDTFQKVNLVYDFSDNTQLDFGLAHLEFNDPKSPLHPFDKEDRITFAVKYFF